MLRNRLKHLAPFMLPVQVYGSLAITYSAEILWLKATEIYNAINPSTWRCHNTAYFNWTHVCDFPLLLPIFSLNISHGKIQTNTIISSDKITLDKGDFDLLDVCRKLVICSMPRLGNLAARSLLAC